MTKGQKLIYGNNDKAHSIECVYTGEYRITKDGNIIISATCNGGSVRSYSWTAAALQRVT